jgi:N-acetylgalactosamine-6-sulfatase
MLDTCRTKEIAHSVANLKSSLCAGVFVALAFTGGCVSSAAIPIEDNPAPSDQTPQAQEVEPIVDLSTDMRSPNIIFIFADDLGWGDLSFRGNATIETPHLDQLAAEGTEFLNFTVSNPVCSPSRAAIMTGLYPSRTSVHRHFATLDHHKNFSMPDWLATDVTLMPRILQSAGYRTAHIGKWHLTSRHVPDAPLPIEYGYDESAVFNGPGPQVGYEELYDVAVDYIHANKDHPFFLNLWVHETHTPHYPSEEGLEKYAHLELQERVYAAVVHDADKRIGKVLDAIEEAGIADNTLVIFTSDNGPEVTESEDLFYHTGRRRAKDGEFDRLGRYFSVGTTGGLRGQKRDTYEGGIRVPFVARWPGKIPAGVKNEDAIVTAVDLLPTFASIANAELPLGYESDGQDVSEAFLGAATIERQKPMFWHWNYGISKSTGEPTTPLLAVREDNWKLFINADGTVELYDLSSDLSEDHNLSSEHPDRVERMKGLALAWEQTLPDSPPASAISNSRDE